MQNKVTEFDLTLVLGVNRFADDMCGFLAIVVKLQFYSDNVLPKEASATLTYYHTRGWWDDSACMTSVTWVAVSVERYYRCVLRKMHQPYGLLLRMMQLDGRNREVRAQAMRSVIAKRREEVGSWSLGFFSGGYGKGRDFQCCITEIALEGF